MSAPCPHHTYTNPHITVNPQPNWPITSLPRHQTRPYSRRLPGNFSGARDGLERFSKIFTILCTARSTLGSGFEMISCGAGESEGDLRAA